MADEDDALSAEIESESDAGSDSEKPGRRRMTEAEFAAASAHWEAGTHRLDELAEMYGVNPDSLKKRFFRAGVKRASRIEDATTATREAIRTKEDERAEKAEQTRRERYDWARALGITTMKKIQETQKTGGRYVSILEDLKALNFALRNINISAEERWKALGLDKDQLDSEELTELMVTELTADDLQRLQQGHDAADQGESADDLLDGLGEVDLG